MSVPVNALSSAAEMSLEVLPSRRETSTTHCIETITSVALEAAVLRCTMSLSQY